MARLIREQRYADAAVVFAAGSLVRGDGTAYFDLDLVVVYPKVPRAYPARRDAGYLCSLGGAVW